MGKIADILGRDEHDDGERKGGLIARKAEAERQRLGAILDVAGQKQPDQFAKDLEASEKAGIPVDAVEENRDTVDKRLKQREIDPAKLLAESPKVGKWLMDPSNASIAHDDIQNLTAMEREALLWRQTKQKVNSGLRGKESDGFLELGLAIRTGTQQLASGQLALLMAYGRLSPDEYADTMARSNRNYLKLLEQRPSFAQEAEAAMMAEGAQVDQMLDLKDQAVASQDNWLTKGMAWLTGMMGAQMEAMEMGGEAIKNPRGTAFLTAEQLPNSVPSIVAGFAGSKGGAAIGSAGGPLGSFVGGTAGFVAGSSGASVPVEMGAWILSDMMDAGIDPTDPEQIKQYFADTERLDRVKGEAERKGLTTAGVDAVFNLTAGKFIPKAGKGAGMGRRAAGTAADIGVQSVGETASEAAGQYAAVGEVDAGDALLEGILSGPQSAVDTAIGHSISKLKEARASGDDQATMSELIDGGVKAEQAKAGAGRLQKLLEIAKNARVTERSKSRADKLMQDLLEDSEFYVDGGELSVMLQEAGIPANEALEALGIDVGEFHQAAATGGDVAIAAHRYVSWAVANEQLAENLNRKVRTGADSMSLEDAEQWDSEARQTLEEYLNQDVPDDDPSQAIYEDVFGQLTASGAREEDAKWQAQLMQAFFRTAGQRTGNDPIDLWNKYSLRIGRETPEALRGGGDIDMALAPLVSRLRAGEMPTDSDVYGQSLVEFLRERGGIIDEGGELDARDADIGNRPFQRKLIQGDGMTMDEAAEAAMEAGYIGEYDQNQLLEAVDRELRGEPVYVEANMDRRTANLREALELLDEELRQRGMDMDSMSDEQIIQALRDAQQEQLEGDQIEQPGTPAFDAWFGDSKVVDENGEPLVVYHGTKRDVAAFIPRNHFGPTRPKTRGGQMVGKRDMHFFSSSPEVASEFAGEQQRFRSGQNTLAPNLVPVYLSIKNPIIIDAAGKPWGDTQQDVIDAYDSGEYDGAIVRNSQDGMSDDGPSSDVYVAFSATQIKSVNNRGTFDPNDPNILNQEDAEEFTGPFREYPELLRESVMDERRADLESAGVEVTDEQLAAIAARAQPRRDEVTGAYAREARRVLVREAMRVVRQNGTPAQYISIDLANLGGLNQAGGTGDVDRFIFRPATEIVQRELEAAGAESVSMIRQGGDEVSAVVVGLDNATVQQAMDKASESFQNEVVRRLRTKDESKTPVSELGNPKGGPPGTTLYRVVADVPAESDVDTYVSRVDAQVEAEKKARKGTLKDEAAAVGFEWISEEEADAIGQRLADERAAADRGQGRPRGDAEDAESVPDAQAGGGRNSEAGRRPDILARIGQLLGLDRLNQESPAQAGLSDSGVQEFARAVQDALGLTDFELSYNERTNAITLRSIIVPKDEQRGGKGSEAVRQLVNFADQHGVSILLTPAHKDKKHGTTSRSRLVKFYKQFGFVENKGRNKDFSTMEGMYREPVSRLEQSQPVTETPEFRAWAGTDDPVIEPNEVNDFDFSGEGPFVLRVFHGTTNTFTEFNASIKGTKEGQFGAVNYFTSSEQDATDNYAGAGPDLTARIENLSERLEHDIEQMVEEFSGDVDDIAMAINEQHEIDLQALDIPFVENDEDQGIDVPELARMVADRALHGGDENVLELFVRTERPFVVGTDDSPFIEFIDFDALQDQAIERVADNNGIEASEVQENIEEYEDEIEEARWDIESEEGNKLLEAIETVASRYDSIDAQELFAAVSEFAMDGTRHSELEKLLREQEQLAYAEDPETGDLAGYHALGEIIQELGFDSIILKNADDRFSNMAIEPGTAHIHVFDANNTNIKSATDNRGTFERDNPNILEQNDKGPRGYMTFDAARNFGITLTNRADLSTFLHEAGHFFLEVMADSAEQSPEVAADFQQVLDWLGVESRDDILLTGKRKNSPEYHRAVQAHEKWARGFEAYLREGKAPSEELRGAFARFRAWLVAIYRQVRGLNVDLSDEVRGVMDRLLATDDEIAAAKRGQGYKPVFADAAAAGMTEEEWGEYQAAVERAEDEAQRQMAGKALDEYRRAQSDWWKERRAEIEQEVLKELDANPAYVALSWLRNGTMPSGADLPNGIKPAKLDKQSLLDLYGQAFLTKNLRRLNVYRLEGGIHVRAAADMLGFKSADEMVKKMVDAVPMREYTKAEAERRMQEQYPDMFQSGEASEAAMDAVHNDKQGELLYREATLLGRRLDRKPSAKQVVRQLAKQTIAGKPIRKVKPTVYRMAEAKAGRLAFEAAARGDRVEAFNQKQRQMLNFYLYREAQKAVEEADIIAKRMRDLNKKSAQQRLGKAGGGFLEQVNQILEQYEFRKVSLRDVERRQSLRDWLNAMRDGKGEGLDVGEAEAAGLASVIPEHVFEQVKPVNYRELSLEQLQGVDDSVRAITHLARLKNKLLKIRDQRELEEVVAEVVATIEQNGEGGKKKLESRLPAEEAKRTLAWFFASHRKLASILKEMDGLVDGGVMWETIMRPLNEAGDREAQMKREAGEKLEALYGLYSRDERVDMYEQRYIEAIKDNLSKQGAIAIALNWGNEDSRQKVMDGLGWSEWQVQQVLDTLDQRDWKFVQGMWELVNSYWPEIEAKEKRVAGVAPEKVQGIDVQTKFGVISGGYYPLMYDDRTDVRTYQQNAEQMAQEMMNGARTSATTRRGHTQERVKGVKRKIRLDLGVPFEHINQVIHDLTHHEALYDVTRILRQKKVADAIIDNYGDIIYRQMQDALTDIAAGDVDSGRMFEKAFNWLRSGVTIAGMGWSVSTALMQPIGITQSFQRVGHKWVWQGLKRYMRGPVDATGFVYERSEFMRNRADTLTRDINDIRNRVKGKGKFKQSIDRMVQKVAGDYLNPDAVADSYFWMIAKLQQLVDTPTWLGEYEKQLSLGKDEATAARMADQAVIDSQGSGQAKDLAAIQRGTPLMRLWTVFYSYFNTLYNLTAESVKRTDFRRPGDVGLFATDMLLLYFLPAALSMAVREGMGSADDDEDLWVKYARELASYPLGTMVGVRELSGAVAGYYNYSGPAGARFFNEAGNLYRQAAQGEVDKAFLKALNNTAGIVFHYPATQVRRTVEGMVEIGSGDTANPTVLLTGPRRD